MTLAFDLASLPNQWAPWLKLLADFAAKGTALLLAAGVIVIAMRRASAATRHLALSLSFATLLVLPVLSLILPEWRISIPQAVLLQAESNSVPNDLSETSPPIGNRESPSLMRSSAAAEAQFKQLEAINQSVPVAIDPPATVPAEPESPAAAPDRAILLLAIWLLGAAAVVGRMLIGTASIQRLRRRAEPITDAAWTSLAAEVSIGLGIDRPVSLLKSERVAMPLTCGALEPAVLVPENALDWDDPRKRVVLKHELAHVKRRDCLTQMLANLACAVYWFNPLVWIAAKRLRVERERACDDWVLESGTKPSEYADHLLDLARSFANVRCSTFAAVAMAKRSQLEGRLMAILDPKLSRRSPNRLRALLITVAVISIAGPIGAIRLTAQARNTTQQTYSPVVSDAQPMAYANTDTAPTSESIAGNSTNLQSRAEGADDVGEVELEQSPDGDSQAFSGSATTWSDPALNLQDEREKGAAIEALKGALKDEDAQVRQQAMSALGMLHDKSALEAFKSALNDKDPQIRSQAVWALGVNGDDSVIEPLIRALQDQDARVREQAAWGLGLKGDNRAVEPLSRALKDQDEKVRSQAAWALGLKGNGSTVDDLGKALTDSSARVRAQAAWALGLKGNDRAVEPLTLALKDDNGHVRSMAAWALGLKGDQRAAEALSVAMKDQDKEVRQQAAWALGMLLVKGGADEDSDQKKDKSGKKAKDKEKVKDKNNEKNKDKEKDPDESASAAFRHRIDTKVKIQTDLDIAVGLAMTQQIRIDPLMSTRIDRRINLLIDPKTIIRPKVDFYPSPDSRRDGPLV